MKKFSAEMDFAKDELRLFGNNTKLPIQINAAGQYMIPVIEFLRGVLLAEQVDVQENMFVSPEIDGRVPVSAAADAQPPSSLSQAPPEDTSAVPDKPVVPEVNKTPGVIIMDKKGKFKDYWVIKPELREIICIFLRSRLKKITTCQVHCPVLLENVSHQRTIRWRIAGTHETIHDIQDSWTEPSEAHGHVKIPIGNYWIGEIIFMLSPQLPSSTNSEGSNGYPDKHDRCLSRFRNWIGLVPSIGLLTS
jgi:hypothetical protein